MRLMRSIATMVLVLFCGCAARDFVSRPVGPVSEDKFVLPVSQILTPAGQQIPLSGMRPQALALSPNGRLLVTSGKTNSLAVIDASSGKILQLIPLPAGEQGTSGSSHTLVHDTKAQLSFTGLIFSQDGKRIYMSDVNGSVKVFEVADDGVRAVASIALPKAGLPRRTNDIPSGLALSPDGKRLYVVLNLSNRLLEMDAATGKTLRFFDVGVAPFDVRLAGKKAYVSNWGGRRPDTNSITGPAGRGTLVRVDAKRYIASEGSVSIIDLQSGQVKAVMAGLHASGLAVSHAGYLVIANAGSDSVTVLDTRTDRVLETISLRWQPKDYFGASPNALTFDSSGDTLYVCNGTQNAIAVVDF